MRTLAHVALAFTLAIVVSVTLLSSALFLPVGLGFLVIAILGILVLRNSPWMRVPLIALGLGLGFLWMSFYPSLTYNHGESLNSDTPQPFTATLIDTPYEGDYWVALTISVDHPDGDLKATLWIDALPEEGIAIGHTLTGNASWTYTDPFTAEELTYSMVNDGSFLSGALDGDLTVTTPDILPFSVWATVLSQTMGEKLLSVYPEDTGALAVGLLTGDTSYMDDDLYAAFQRTGVAHVVAVSGMHISFLAGVIFLLLGSRGSKKSILIAICILFSFAAVTGNSPSVLRAVFLQIFLLLAPLFGRENDKITSLSTALMILLMANPFAILSVSLQLSFAAVSGIYLITGPLYQRWTINLPSRPKVLFIKIKVSVLRFVFSTLATTLGALLFTVPIMAYHFETVSLIAPLTNLLTLWAVSGGFLGTMLVAVVAFVCTPLATGLAWVVSLFLRYLITVVTALAAIPFASASTDTLAIILWLILTYGMLAVYGYQRYRRKPTTPLPFFLSGCFLIFALLFTAMEGYSGDARIAILDVGQGQSILITSGGSTMLVDCGGDDAQEAGTLAADQIQSLGTSHLDLLVLTHCHDDHAGGVITLFQRLTIDTIILPATDDPLDLQLEIEALAQEQGTQIIYLSEQATATLGEVELTLYPPVLHEDSNEEGLFVLCSVAEFDMLITGDVGQLAEKTLLRYYTIPDLELLMVGHHGSSGSTSETLLTETTPEYAVISVGENNSYGHPTDDVLERLTLAGCTIYRTDQMGTITFTLN